MRIWHNFYPVGDIVEYIPKSMYGVVEYPEGMAQELGNHRWLATMMSEQDVDDYLDWCWRECDRLIWNLTRKPGEKEWLPGDEDKEEENE
jgi:hypothetical protein